MSQIFKNLRQGRNPFAKYENNSTGMNQNALDSNQGSEQQQLSKIGGDKLSSRYSLETFFKTKSKGVTKFTLVNVEEEAKNSSMFRNAVFPIYGTTEIRKFFAMGFIKFLVLFVLLFCYACNDFEKNVPPLQLFRRHCFFF